MRRFAGTAVALGVLGVVVWLAWPRSVDPPAARGPLIDFEPAELVQVEVVRGSERLDVRRSDGGWALADGRWRPARLVMRRIVHQLHALEARAEVSGVIEADLGLGPEAPRVRLVLRDGTEHRLRIGAANPTGVSHYVQVPPDPAVYLVQRAAVDLFVAPLDAWREDRITWVENADVVSFRVDLDGQVLEAEETGGEWRVRTAAPSVAEVPPDALRLLLGRLTALRSRRVVEDQPDDLDRHGLGASAGRVEIRVADGVRWSLRVGEIDENGSCLVHHEQDDAVYEVACGFRSAVPRPR